MSLTGSAQVVGGNLYVCCGYTGSQYSDRMDMYNPKEASWTELARSPEPKSSAAVGVYESKIFVAGGYSGSTHTSSAFVFDIVTNTWDRVAPMGISRTGARGTVVDGLFYVIGGWHLNHKAEEPVGDRKHNKSGNSMYHCSYSMLDVASGQWTYAEMPQPRVDAMVMECCQ